MTSQPLVPDPYETAMVEVRQSSVPGAEEGLFARHEYLEYFLAFKLNIVGYLPKFAILFFFFKKFLLIWILSEK